MTVADEELVMSHLLFSKDWQEKIGNLRIKDSITFEGRIDRIESDDVVLIDCSFEIQNQSNEGSGDQSEIESLE